jgi:hypothetical protein
MPCFTAPVAPVAPAVLDSMVAAALEVLTRIRILVPTRMRMLALACILGVARMLAVPTRMLAVHTCIPAVPTRIPVVITRMPTVMPVVQCRMQAVRALTAEEDCWLSGAAVRYFC